MNKIIKFETKSHYGGPELIYVVSEHKEPLQVLTGSKTLTERHVKALKELGFEFSEGDKAKRILSTAGHVRYIAYQLHEAGIKDWLKKIMTKIPGLPSKEQALKTVAPLVEKDPKKFERAVDEIFKALQGVPLVGLGKTAFDVRGLIRNLKVLTDPKAILAIIALMGAFQTTEAGPLISLVKNIRGKVIERKTEREHLIKELFNGTHPIVDQIISRNPGKVKGYRDINDHEHGKITLGFGISLDRQSQKEAEDEANLNANIFESKTQTIFYIVVKKEDKYSVMAVTQDWTKPVPSFLSVSQQEDLNDLRDHWKGKTTEKETPIYITPRIHVDKG